MQIVNLLLFYRFSKSYLHFATKANPSRDLPWQPTNYGNDYVVLPGRESESLSLVEECSEVSFVFVACEETFAVDVAPGALV